MNWGTQSLPNGHWSATLNGEEIACGKEDDQLLGQVAAMMACAKEMKKRHLLERARLQDEFRARKVEGR